MRETINSRKLMQMSMKEGAKFQPYQAELSFNYGHVVLDLESKIQKKEGGTCRISLYGKKKSCSGQACFRSVPIWSCEGEAWIVLDTSRCGDTESWDNY